MNRFKYLLLISVILLSSVLRVDAQVNDRPQSPPKYQLELVYIFEDEATEFIFVIGNVGFKSIGALKKFLSGLPPGSTLEWSPGCIRRGNEPLLSSKEELDDFKAFCAEHNINFVLVPAG